jgi:hypothetical protein
MARAGGTMSAADNVIPFPQPESEELFTKPDGWIRCLRKTDLIAALERIPGNPMVEIKAPDIEGFETCSIKAVGFHNGEIVLYPVLALIEDENFRYDHLESKATQS